MLCFVIMLWFSRKARPAWAVSALFLIGYGGIVSLAKFFREPDAHLVLHAFGWMTRGQLLCIPMLMLGCYMLWYAYLRPGAKGAM